MKRILSLVLAIFMLSGLTACNNIPLFNSEKKEYISAMYNALDVITENSEELSECSDLYLDVWHNAIHEERDKTTDKYTMQNGRFVEDFNIALDNLYSDEDFKEKINSIDEAQKNLRKLKIKLEDVPRGAEKFAPSLMGLIDTYIEYATTVLNCRGSYNDNSEKISELNDLFLDYSQEFSAYEDVIKEFAQ